MIKIKDIIQEHKIRMTEAFAAGKLRALSSNDWNGLDSAFWSYGAKLGIQWDKITDKQIETNTKPKKIKDKVHLSELETIFHEKYGMKIYRNNSHISRTDARELSMFLAGT